MYSIDPDIRRSHTLPGSFYRDANAFDAVRERVLTRCWHYVADTTDLPEPSYVWPWLLLPGVPDEPLMLTRDRTGALHCLSNVCTHRGNVLALEPGPARLLRCNYHGRCFGHDGTFCVRDLGSVTGLVIA